MAGTGQKVVYEAAAEPAGLLQLMLRDHKFAYKYGQHQMLGLAQVMAIGVCLLYWLGIYLLQLLVVRWDYPPQHMRRTGLALYGGMVAFSLTALYRLLPELVWAIRKLGLDGSICECGGYFDGISGYWVWLCVYFSVIEMVPSFLLVLKQRPVSLLHRAYYSCAVAYQFIVYPMDFAFYRWALMLKLLMHFVLQAHAFGAAVGLRVSRSWERYLAIAQLVRFSLCLFALVAVVFAKLSPLQQCDGGEWPVVLGSLLAFGLQLVGYVRYYYKTHIEEKKLREKSDKRDAIQRRAQVSHRRDSFGLWHRFQLSRDVDMSG